MRIRVRGLISYKSPGARKQHAYHVRYSLIPVRPSFVCDNTNAARLLKHTFLLRAEQTESIIYSRETTRALDMLVQIIRHQEYHSRERSHNAKILC